MRPFLSTRHQVQPVGKYEFGWPFVGVVMGLWRLDINACRTYREALPLIEAAGQEFSSMRAAMNPWGRA